MTHWNQLIHIKDCSLISIPSASVYLFSGRIWKMAGLHAFTWLCTVIICMAHVCSMPTNCRLQKRLMEECHNILEKMVSCTFIWCTSCIERTHNVQQWASYLLFLSIRERDFLCTVLKAVFLSRFPRPHSSSTRLNRWKLIRFYL